ncbi:hypothetical protein ACRE_061720 [Hapsidospora chrysogenum ATCC 11550]|uniref:Uncharacterized protein n=1 Tax=Hapsidospora chrysogenum (strain ATCC 11550 / CBS 779.69 / DSM 880 / IAM 14645 / JCM 23072 / IMI 49137) TaxID=857340 RepID=A0A086T134_HAPC1|nr:hypothetical protein ACRE_061720 [Hapsidospora chrysogenum ATCC 11550]
MATTPAARREPQVEEGAEEGTKKSLPREPPGLTTLDSHPRLSMATPARIALGSAVAGLIGFSLGATQGGQAAQLRFRAEHAHKMPDSTTGWYLYHKTKNYHAMQGGIREGMRMGARTSFWSFMALSLESTVDRFRGASDMFSTIIASLSVAGGFSLWHRFSITTAARTARSGFLFGLAYGGVQDILGLARGRPIGYIDFVRRRFAGGSGDSRSSSSPGQDSVRAASS